MVELLSYTVVFRNSQYLQMAPIAHGSLMLLEEIFLRLSMDNQTRKKLIGTFPSKKNPYPLVVKHGPGGKSSMGGCPLYIPTLLLCSHLPTLLSHSNLHLSTHVPIPASHQPQILRTNHIIYIYNIIYIYIPHLSRPTFHRLKDRFPCCLIVARIASPAKGLGDGLKGVQPSSAKAVENRVTKHQSMDWFFKGKSTGNHGFYRQI